MRINVLLLGLWLAGCAGQARTPMPVAAAGQPPVGPEAESAEYELREVARFDGPVSLATVADEGEEDWREDVVARVEGSLFVRSQAEGASQVRHVNPNECPSHPNGAFLAVHTAVLASHRILSVGFLCGRAELDRTRPQVQTWLDAPALPAVESLPTLPGAGLHELRGIAVGTDAAYAWGAATDLPGGAGEGAVRPYVVRIGRGEPRIISVPGEVAELTHAAVGSDGSFWCIGPTGGTAELWRMEYDGRWSKHAVQAASDDRVFVREIHGGQGDAIWAVTSDWAGTSFALAAVRVQ